MIKTSVAIVRIPISKLIMVLLILVLACGKGSRETQQVPDVSEEPNHRLVYENDLFQILDIQFLPGDTSLFHKHSRPTLYTSLGWYGSAWQSPKSDWDSSTEHWPAGGIEFNDSYLKEPEIHRVTNIGSEPSRIIALVHKGSGIRKAEESDRYEIANPWFRVQRMNLASQDTLLTAVLPKSSILIFPEAMQLTKVNERAASLLSEKWLLTGLSEILVNQSDQIVEVIAVEVLN